MGLGEKDDYLPVEASTFLRDKINKYLNPGVTFRGDKTGFPASQPNRIAAFAKTYKGVNSVQIEMKPTVRIPFRRSDASMFAKPLSEGGGPYSAPTQNVLGMMQALVDLVEYSK